MKAEIISIGSEITSGRNLDTNSQWLSRRLAAVGIPVGWHTTVADDLDANIDVFRTASRRASLVLATGGLGPTQDDLTREVLAGLAGVDLVLDPPSLDRIKAMFQRRGRVMPERNSVQAMFPRGAEVLVNERGTAPGAWLQIGSSYVAAMPGVPSEMYDMYEKQVEPRALKLGLGGEVLIERKINAFGAGESAVEAKLLDLTRRDHQPEVGITVSDATVSLRILAKARDRATADAIIAPVEATIRERLGEWVFGTQDEELQDVVIASLANQRKSLAVAEGVTGGLVGELLTAVPGASAWFRGGIVAYDNRIKIEMLGVDPLLIQTDGAVSAKVAEAMAVGCRTRWQTDLALSTVGIAGPADLGPDKPAGLVYVALASASGVISTSFSWTGTRAEVRRRCAKLALNTVRLFLLAKN